MARVACLFIYIKQIASHGSIIRLASFKSDAPVRDPSAAARTDDDDRRGDMKSLHLAMAGGRCRRQGNTGRQVAGAGTGRQGNMQGVPETNRFDCKTSSAMESSGEGEVERESASESAAGACPDGASESAPARASYCYFSYSCGHLGVGTPPA